MPHFLVAGNAVVLARRGGRTSIHAGEGRHPCKSPSKPITSGDLCKSEENKSPLLSADLCLCPLPENDWLREFLGPVMLRHWLRYCPQAMAHLPKDPILDTKRWLGHSR